MACVAYGCKSRSSGKSDEDRNFSFHRFPVDEKLKDVWVMAVRRNNWKPSKHSRLCSKHFESSCYLDDKKKKMLCKDAVPTIFKSYPTYLQKDSSKLASNKTIDSQRKLRRISRNLQSVLDQPSPSGDSYVSSVTSESFTEPHIDDSPRKKELKKIIAKQSKISSKRLKKLKILQQTCRRLKQKIASLQNIVSELKSKNLINDEAAQILSNIMGENKLFYITRYIQVNL